MSSSNTSTSPTQITNPTQTSQTTTSQPPPEPDPQRTAQARAAFTAHLASIGQSHLQPLEQRAADIATNAKAISAQEASLSKETPKLSKESDKLQKEADSAAKKLKELGDIQNWAEVLERDLLVVESALRMGEGEDLEWETEEEWEGDRGEPSVDEGVGTAREKTAKVAKSDRDAHDSKDVPA